MKAMRSIITCLLAIFLLAAVGCAEAGDAVMHGFALAHYDVSEADGALDSDYFYRNDLTVVGGDADIEWVSEEKDPEWGGYYYLYSSGNVANGHNTYYKEGKPLSATSREEAAENVDHKSSIYCLRSKDMNSWELCGQVDDGLACYFEADSWVKGYFWAPEVVYDNNTQKYYMYMTAISYDNYDGLSEDTQYGYADESMYDTFYILVMESETPAGPFRLVESENYYAGLEYEEMNEAQKATYDETGKLSNLNGKVLTHRNPTINFTYDLGLSEGTFAAIDCNPFLDDDGTLYLSFVRHISTGHLHNCGWIVRMKDMVTPDFSTLTLATYCNYEYVTDENVGDEPQDRVNEDAYTKHNCFAIPSYLKDSLVNVELCERLEAASRDGTTATVMDEDGATPESWTKNAGGTWVKDGWEDEGTINEGMHMWRVGDRYYYCYSPRGFSDMNYDTKQSISDTGALGPFYKLPQKPAVVCGRGWGDYTNAEMSGTGHHAFIEVDGEMFIIYYVHADPTTVESGALNGRWYAFDRVTTYEDATYGTLLSANGPTKTAQYKPSTYTGLTNVASWATVSATNCEEGTIKYLTDGFVACHEHFLDREFVAKGKTTITLKFNRAVTISALMVYNTMEYEKAFASIDFIQFHLAKAADWMDEAHADLRDCYIEDVGFSADYIDTAMRKISMGGAAAVSFNEITVDEITITISQKVASNLEADVADIIKISDIVVLGK